MASDSSGTIPSILSAATTTIVTGVPPSSPPPKMMTCRTCSLCGSNGHNSRTCTESSCYSSTSSAAVAAANGEFGGGGNGFMLFGVRVTAEAGNGVVAASSSTSFRKSASMTNLSQFDTQPQESSANDVVAAGYASDDALHAAGRGRERKRGVPWTEEEHKLFLLGLQKVGKGDWRGIAKNFVKTRTPTQVASHAQKYFLRRSNLNRRRRRSSLFDITTETVMSSHQSIEEHFHREFTSKPPISSHSSKLFSPNLPPSTPFHPIMSSPPPLPMKLADLDLNESPGDQMEQQQQQQSLPMSMSYSPTRSNSDDKSRSFQTVGFSGNGGDSIISVA